ncbi:MAG: hypothetical protein IKF91_01280 [Bacilli bacterium]|nr:hypothetical protein [Bacilli bacterium]
MIYGYHIINSDGRYIIIFPVILLTRSDNKYLIYRKSRNQNAKTYIGKVVEKNEVVPIEEIVMEYYK